MTTTGLEWELLQAICVTCNVQDIDQAGVSADDPLVGPDSVLGLDSLDALEIVVMVQKNYGVRIASEDTSRVVLQSLGILARFIEKNRP